MPAKDLPKFRELCFSEVLSNEFIRSEYEGMEAGVRFQQQQAYPGGFLDRENMTLHIMLSGNTDWDPIINWARLKYPHWFNE